MQVNKSNIWNFKQNKPTYVVREIRAKYPEVSEDFIYEVLLKCGVFKWFAVRRSLIKLKDEWKNKIKGILFAIRFIKVSGGNEKYVKKNLQYYKGYLKGYEECRKAIRELCHSDRWQAPDFDKQASKFLKKIEEKNLIQLS